jgi:hypothetical protein
MLKEWRKNLKICIANVFEWENPFSCFSFFYLSYKTSQRRLTWSKRPAIVSSSSFHLLFKKGIDLNSPMYHDYATFSPNTVHNLSPFFISQHISIVRFFGTHLKSKETNKMNSNSKRVELGYKIRESRKFLSSKKILNTMARCFTKRFIQNKQCLKRKIWQRCFRASFLL